jgi:hypothetical protein
VTRAVLASHLISAAGREIGRGLHCARSFLVDGGVIFCKTMDDSERSDDAI